MGLCNEIHSTNGQGFVSRRSIIRNEGGRRVDRWVHVYHAEACSTNSSSEVNWVMTHSAREWKSSHRTYRSFSFVNFRHHSSVVGRGRFKLMAEPMICRDFRCKRQLNV